jgi:hypothetical protein
MFFLISLIFLIVLLVQVLGEYFLIIAIYNLQILIIAIESILVFV